MRDMPCLAQNGQSQLFDAQDASARAYLPLVLFLLLLGELASASTRSISVPVTTVGELVAVNSSIDFTRIIPGYEYRGLITISWNAPEGAVNSVTASEVPVYVLLSTNESGPVYFRRDKSAGPSEPVRFCESEEPEAVFQCVLAALVGKREKSGYH